LETRHEAINKVLKARVQGSLPVLFLVLCHFLDALVALVATAMAEAVVDPVNSASSSPHSIDTGRRCCVLLRPTSSAIDEAPSLNSDLVGKT
jgi:hypothetical protein